MIEMLGLPAASSFADDIDMVFSVIFWIVFFWFLLAEGVFFYLIFAGPGEWAIDNLRGKRRR